METEILKVDYGKKKLQLNQIKYIKSVDGNYSLIVLKEGKNYLSAFTLKKYAEQLESTDNFRLARKGLLLNLEYINDLEKTENVKFAVLKTGEKFQLSRRIGNQLLGYLKNKKSA